MATTTTSLVSSDDSTPDVTIITASRLRGLMSSVPARTATQA